MDVVDPREHESGAHLLFANPDDPDDPGLNRYFGIVSQYDRIRELADQEETFEAAGETWRFNHNPGESGPSISYWTGKIKTREKDSGDAYYEYNVPLVAVDSVGEKKVNLQFRPGLPNATHVETDEPIGGLPEDMPHGLRVQIASANVSPHEYHSILTELFRFIGITTTHLDDIHPWSRVTAFAVYVRLDRDLSESRIVSQDGLLERLARFTAVRRGKGEWKWDNEEIMGHRNAVTFNPTSLEKLYGSHRLGKLLKSYHMKHPSTDQGAITYHPKLEVQWNKEYSSVKAAHWHSHPHELDRHDLQEELETFLYHALYWAGLPLDPDPEVYIEDAYFAADATARELNLVEDPTDQLEVQQRDLTVAQLLDADLTEKQHATVRETVQASGVRSIDEIAEQASVSESTVRRTFRKLDQIVEIAAGKVRPADRVVAEKLHDVFASIDQVLNQGKRSLRGLAGRGELVEEGSLLGKWASRYAVNVDEVDPEMIHVAINLGELTEWQAMQIIRAGREAAELIGPHTHQRFVRAMFTYTDRKGERRQKGFGKFGHTYQLS